MNIYYSPEQYGLETVGQVDWSDEPYQFDMTVVWRRVADGQLFYASDSGCSCPSPFEDTGVDDLTAASMFEISTYLIETGKKQTNYYGDDDISDRVAMEISQLMGRLATK